MYYALTTTLLLAAVTSVTAKTGNLGDAKVHTDNPAGKQFTAAFYGTGAHGNLQFNLTNFNNKTGVFVKLDLTAYRGDEGPFKLALYEAPVTNDGKCDGAKNVLDPFQRGDKPECDKKNPQTCQVGDLVGKHGEVPKFQGVISVKQSFQDLYLSFKKEESAFIGGRSVIIKNGKGDKIACANVAEVNSPPRGWDPKGGPGVPGAPPPPPPPPPGSKKGEGPGHGPGSGPGSPALPWKNTGPPGGPPPKPTTGGPFHPAWLKGDDKDDKYKPKGHKSWLSKLFDFDGDDDDDHYGRRPHGSPWGRGSKWDRDDDDEYNGYR
ncbi:hypothetical protein L873DRAFT_1685876 [Choiromyces venosus 120613-1]|uniref:Superoxide dismutase copper/zinc binding domain-containing protein n=1 Tax=Choiromyces venosus 120613-1 TaxID=1336337 RepID=A0A3N4JL00_9PEZI|nr:hypothetical protein L873DRAFT_1685876 [Choiromyces venosus 120613-1]